MAVAIPDQYQDLFQKKAFAHLGTLRRPGEERGMYKIEGERVSAMG